jgi:hypothetical protein
MNYTHNKKIDLGTALGVKQRCSYTQTQGGSFMKLTLLLLALSIGISAQAPKTTYFGDRSKGEFYPVACGVASSIPSENWIVFDSREDAERRGYQYTVCPVDPRNAKVKTVKASNRASSLRVAMITHEPSRWLGKFVTVQTADLKLTDVWKFDDKTFAFRISDGPSGFYLYMDKRAAMPLRDLILKRSAADGIAGSFTLYLDPKGYQNGSEVYGRLVSYNVK